MSQQLVTSWAGPAGGGRDLRARPGVGPRPTGSPGSRRSVTLSCLGTIVVPGRSETFVEPPGANDLCSQVTDPLTQPSVRSDKDDAGTDVRGLGDQLVVALTVGVHDAYAVNLCLGDACAGRAFDHDHRRQREPSLSCRLAQLSNELASGPRPITPPSRWPGTDDIGGVDDQHGYQVRADHDSSATGPAPSQIGRSGSAPLAHFPP